MAITSTGFSCCLLMALKITPIVPYALIYRLLAASLAAASSVSSIEPGWKEESIIASVSPASRSKELQKIVI